MRCRSRISIISVVGLFCSFFMSGAVGASESLDPVEIARLLKKASLMITTEFGIGTGYFISKHHIITNYHVVKGSNTVKAASVGSPREPTSVKVIASDPAVDLALLYSENENPDFIRAVFPNRPPVGERVFTLGNPQAQVGTFSDGVVSNNLVISLDLFSFTAPISEGSSGGAVVNGRGELIGTVSGFLREGQNLNVAIPAKYISRLFLNQSGILTDSGLSAEQESALISDCSFVTPTIPHELDPMPGKFSEQALSSLGSVFGLGDDTDRPPIAYERGISGNGPVQLIIFGQTRIAPKTIEELSGHARSEVLISDIRSRMQRMITDPKNFEKIEIKSEADPFFLRFYVHLNASKKGVSYAHDLFTFRYLLPYCLFWSWERVDPEQPEYITHDDFFLSDAYIMNSTQRQEINSGRRRFDKQAKLRPGVRTVTPYLFVLVLVAGLFVAIPTGKILGKYRPHTLLVIVSLGSLLVFFRRPQTLQHPSPIDLGKNAPVLHRTPEEADDEAEPEAKMETDEQIPDEDSGSEEGAAEGVGEAETTPTPQESTLEGAEKPDEIVRELTFKQILATSSPSIEFIYEYDGRLYKHCTRACETLRSLQAGAKVQWSQTKNEISFVNSAEEQATCGLVWCEQWKKSNQ